MQEAAVLRIRSNTGAPFQRVQDLLAGHLHGAQHVAEGVDGLAGLIRPLTGRRTGADTAAVHNGHIAADTLILIIDIPVICVGVQVAHVGCLLADSTVTVGILVRKGDLAFGDHFAQLIIHLADPFVLHRLDSSVDIVVFTEQLGVNVTVSVDGQHANILEVGARLGQDNILAVLILYEFLCHFGVGMAVDEGVQTGGVGDHFSRSPGAGGGIDTQVAQGDDVIGAGSLGIFNGGLHIGIQSLAIRAAGDPIDVVAVVILEVLGGGLGEGFRRGDAHKGYFHAVGQRTNHIRRQHEITASAVCIHMIEVAGDIRNAPIVLHIGHSQCALHAVVELMVAQRGHVIAGCGHQTHNGGALIHSAVSGALDMVTGIHQQHIVALFDLVLLQGRDVGIGQSIGLCQVAVFILDRVVVDVGMYIVGVDDHNLSRGSSRGLSAGRGRGLVAGRGRGLLTAAGVRGSGIGIRGFLSSHRRTGRGIGVVGPGGGHRQRQHHRQGQQDR